VFIVPFFIADADLSRKIMRGIALALEGAIPPVMFIVPFFVADLSRKIMHGIALALGGAIHAFEGETAADPFWVSSISKSA
jgi:hypothetical protein